MGILRNREELLPVTCAVLKENEREMFFNDVRRKAAGNMDRVAKTVGVPVTTLQDWVNGTSNVPYITLQRLASEFEVEMPTVTELRREFQQIAPAQTQRPAARVPSNPGIIGSGPAPLGVRREPQGVRRDAPPLRSDRAERPARRERPPRPERKARPERAPRPERDKQRAQKGDARSPRAPKPQQQAPRQAVGPRIPKLSDKVAYWTGTVYASARRDGDALVLTARGAYPGLWALLTDGLFGVRPELSAPLDDGLQEARLPVAGLEEFVNRLDLKPDAARPPAPRWAWSNPDWKKAFLKGLVDVSAELTEAPALRIPALGDPLRRSIEKLFAGLSVPVNVGADGSVAIDGSEAVEKYWRVAGSENPALREPLEARYPGAYVPEAPAEAAEAPAAAAAGEARPGGRGRKRRRGRGRGRREGTGAQAGASGAAVIGEVTEHGTRPGDAGNSSEPADAPPPDKTQDATPEV